MTRILLGVWAESSRGDVEAAKVVEAPSGGYLLLTREGGQELDVWLETIEDAEAEVRRLGLRWPDGAIHISEYGNGHRPTATGTIGAAPFVFRMTNGGFVFAVGHDGATEIWWHSPPEELA